MPALDLFLFDLAGTAVRDDGMVLGAYRRIAAAEGLDAPDDWFIARMGVDKDEVFADLLRRNGRPDHRAVELADRFADAVRAHVREHAAEPLPGVLDAVAAMRSAGVKVGYTTGFNRATADAIIASAALPADVAIASDQVERGRPAPDMILECMRRAGVSDPLRVGVAGDTPSDLGSGRAAGCAVIIGVGNGTHTLDELRPHGPTHLAPDLTTLPDILGLRAEEPA